MGFHIEMAAARKRLWLISSAILVVSLILLFEGFSYFYVKYFPEHFISPPREIVDRVDSDWLTRFYRTTYDRNLGWQPKPNFKKRENNTAGKEWQWATDKFGGRRNPDYQASLSPYIATFGNS